MTNSVLVTALNTLPANSSSATNVLKSAQGAPEKAYSEHFQSQLSVIKNLLQEARTADLVVSELQTTASKNGMILPLATTDTADEGHVPVIAMPQQIVEKPAEHLVIPAVTMPVAVTATQAPAQLNSPHVAEQAAIKSLNGLPAEPRQISPQAVEQLHLKAHATPLAASQQITAQPLSQALQQQPRPHAPQLEQQPVLQAHAHLQPQSHAPQIVQQSLQAQQMQKGLGVPLNAAAQMMPPQQNAEAIPKPVPSTQFAQQVVQLAMTQQPQKGEAVSLMAPGHLMQQAMAQQPLEVKTVPSMVPEQMKQQLLQQPPSPELALASRTSGLNNTAPTTAATSLVLDSMPAETDLLFSAQIKKQLNEQFKLPVADTKVPAMVMNSHAEPASSAQLRMPAMQTVMPETSAVATQQSSVPEAFGRPEWNRGMAKQVVWMVSQNVRSAEIRLNPANLGPVEVRIEMDDEQVSVAFSSRNAMVREAVEQSLPRLREMLENDGLNLAETDISQQSFSEQRSELAENSFSGQSANGISSATDDETSADNRQQTLSSTIVANGLVDYYA